MDVSEADRLRTLELDMVQVKTLVGTMKDDVHTIRNAIVWGLLVLISVLFTTVIYFVQQKDDIVDKLNTIHMEQKSETSNGDVAGTTTTKTVTTTGNGKDK